jgi:hypothetical protein
MNKNLLIILAVIVLLGGGLYSMANQSKNQTSKQSGVTKGNTQSHRSYEIDVISKPNANEIKLNEPTTIKYRIKNDKGEVLRNFELAHEKLMHFIIVRKDLQQFEHLHPDFNKENGEFSVDVTFTVDGPYRFFADFTPGQDNPQKLAVALNEDLNVGDVSNFQPHPVVVDTQKKKVIPPDYEASYTLPQNLKAQSNFTYTLNVSKNGQPVTDLENYLGALGHSVILKEATLEYIHTHPEDAMSNDEHVMMGHAMPTSTGPTIDFVTILPEAGTYKIFTQFQHQGRVITTDYVVKAN